MLLPISSYCFTLCTLLIQYGMVAGRGRGVDVENAADAACKVRRSPGRWQGEGWMGWREEDPNSCSVCALVFHVHLRKGSSL